MTEIIARKLRDVYFDDMLHAWIKNKARQERWRVAGWYGVADLIQDGYICYCKCRDKYTLGPPEPGYQDLHTDHPTDTQRRHFMSLVQRAFSNYIITLSNNYPIAQEEPVNCSVTEDSVSMLEGLMPPVPEEASVLMALANAPAEISAAIGVLINDGLEGEAYLRTKLRQRGNRVMRGRRALRETTSEYFQRLLGDGEVQEKTITYLYS